MFLEEFAELLYHEAKKSGDSVDDSMLRLFGQLKQRHDAFQEKEPHSCV